MIIHHLGASALALVAFTCGVVPANARDLGNPAATAMKLCAPGLEMELAPAAPAQPAAFVPVINASRLEGVAPLSVSFDALSSVATGTIHDMTYAWWFGDAASAHPMAFGFAAAHVFEHPGQYTVTLFGIDAAGQSGFAQVVVDVRPFAGRTFYVASSGNDGNDGLDESRPFATFNRAMQALDSALPRNGTPAAVRVLFRRGDTFRFRNGYDFGSNRRGDPVIVGAYGSGERPVLHNENGSTVFGGYIVHGITLMDLDIRGNYDFASGSGNRANLVAFSGGTDRLGLRVTARNGGYGWAELHNNEEPLTNRTGIAIFDSQFLDNADYGCYLMGNRLAFVGNYVNRTRFEHCLRIYWARDAVISGNTLTDPASSKHCLKMHSQRPSTMVQHPQGLATERVMISNNVFAAAVWATTIAPQNTSSVEPIRDVILERNLWVPHTTLDTLSIGLYVLATDVTVRNNVFRGAMSSRDSGGTAVNVEQHASGTPAPRNIRLFNNTAVWPGGSAVPTWFTLLRVAGSSVREVVAANNVGWAPNAGNHNGRVFELAGGFPRAQLEDVNNIVHLPRSNTWAIEGGSGVSLDSWQRNGRGVGSRAIDPGLQNPAGFDLRPRPDSAVREGALLVPGLIDDVLSTFRLLHGMPDIGALEG